MVRANIHGEDEIIGDLSSSFIRLISWKKLLSSSPGATLRGISTMSGKLKNATIDVFLCSLPILTSWKVGRYVPFDHLYRVEPPMRIVPPKPGSRPIGNERREEISIRMKTNSSRFACVSNVLDDSIPYSAALDHLCTKPKCTTARNQCTIKNMLQILE
ncbi:nadph dehydrogenase 2 [Moniliophthora roreri]|nr:nadph dehydrogenase 2 [Moniliophthora roreri]